MRALAKSPLVLVLLVAAAPAEALAPSTQHALVEAARDLLGSPYRLGGREVGRAVDCQGLVFLALQATTGCSWRSFDVYPSTSIPRGELGRPVDGMAPISSEALDAQRLQQGDVIHFVGTAENPAEPAIATLGGAPVWVWHMGLAAGSGAAIIGDHFAGAVVEVDLAEYLRAHADVYAGVFVTRMQDGPMPRRCRPPGARTDDMHDDRNRGARRAWRRRASFEGPHPSESLRGPDPSGSPSSVSDSPSAVTSAVSSGM